MFLGPSGFGGIRRHVPSTLFVGYRGFCGRSKAVRAGVCSMCSFVRANVTLGSAVVLPAKGSTRLQSCVLHCEGKFDPSLCGPREPSAYLKNQCNRLKKGMDANAQQRIMKSSQYQKQLQSKRRKNTKIIDGDTYIEVEGYITSSGKHVKTYWRRVGRRS